MGGTVRRNAIICMIVTCIAIVAISQAQLAQKDEASPLCEYRATQVAEEFGLAPSGSANSGLEFGSVITGDLIVQTKEQGTITKQPLPRDVIHTARCRQQPLSSSPRCDPPRQT